MSERANVGACVGHGANRIAEARDELSAELERRPSARAGAEGRGGEPVAPKRHSDYRVSIVSERARGD